MKNSTSIKKNNRTESPKTPGGISKSLLTPCRRVGLSRNWRKNGSSPFVSPVSGAETNVETKQEQKINKRKYPAEEESLQESQETIEEHVDADTSCNTPRNYTMNRCRNLLPRKKSKTLILANDCEGENENVPQISDITTKESVDSTELEPKPESPKNVQISKLSRSISKSKSKKFNRDEICDTKSTAEIKSSINTQVNSKQKSPDNLAKECIVVIQKNIFKPSIDKIDTCNKLKPEKTNSISQALFDSDSDDTPLIHLNKEHKELSIQTNDDEFQESKQIKKLQHKTTSTTELKTNCRVKQKPNTIKNIIKQTQAEPNIQSSQSTDIDDDDDFICDKRTIIIKKSYDKITKPSKSKSTGSITQKDIDDLKARIEKKKNLFLAKAMTNETAELRSLIKKWQKGCQNALTELLELMKTKMPDRQNMETSEILQLLKIPADLVGYDSENDIFNTPDDTNIVLSGFDIK